MRRHNYVTPTSYLELIMTFKTLLGVRQSEILGLKNRYVTGLQKLEFAASQVSVMQEELQALQPELIQTSAETEKLMVKIEQDTVEVEAKKEVRSCLSFLLILLTKGLCSKLRRKIHCLMLRYWLDEILKQQSCIMTTADGGSSKLWSKPWSNESDT